MHFALKLCCIVQKVQIVQNFAYPSLVHFIMTDIHHLPVKDPITVMQNRNRSPFGGSNKN